METVDMTPTAEPRRNAKVDSSGDKLMAIKAPMEVERPAKVESNSGHQTPPEEMPDVMQLACYNELQSCEPKTPVGGGWYGLEM
jgi:hypothetical protein